MYFEKFVQRKDLKKVIIGSLKSISLRNEEGVVGFDKERSEIRRRECNQKVM